MEIISLGSAAVGILIQIVQLLISLPKRSEVHPDPEKQAYRQRVKTRKRNREARPEWDCIGHCIWYWDPTTENDIQMRYVPQPVQDAFQSILYTNVALGGGPNIHQTTSDQDHTYLMESGLVDGVAFVFFWAKPN